MKRLLFISLLGCVLSTSVGCRRDGDGGSDGGNGTDDGTGDLVVHYQLGSGASGCSELGIARIMAILENEPRGQLSPVTTTCVETRGELISRNVAADLYDVLVYGLDTSETAVFEGVQYAVRVSPDVETETDTIVLEMIEPSLRVIWAFSEGMTCVEANVESIRVAAYHEGASLELDRAAACSDGSMEIEDFPPGVYDIRVRGVESSSGRLTYAWDVNGEDISGPGVTQVVAHLQPCDGECSDP